MIFTNGIRFRESAIYHSLQGATKYHPGSKCVSNGVSRGLRLKLVAANPRVAQTRKHHATCAKDTSRRHNPSPALQMEEDGRLRKFFIAGPLSSFISSSVKSIKSSMWDLQRRTSTKDGATTRRTSGTSSRQRRARFQPRGAQQDLPIISVSSTMMLKMMKMMMFFFH